MNMSASSMLIRSRSVSRLVRRRNGTMFERMPTTCLRSLAHALEADVDGGRAVALERRHRDALAGEVDAPGRLAHGLRLVDPLVHRVVGIEPLRVLLVAVEHERLADEALADQVEHVHHRGRVAKGEADLGLQALRLRELVRRQTSR